MKLIKQHEYLIGFSFTLDQRADLVKCMQMSASDRHTRYACTFPKVSKIPIAESIKDQIRFGFVGDVDFDHLCNGTASEKRMKKSFRFSNQSIVRIQQ